MNDWSQPTKLQYFAFFAAMPVIGFLLNYILYGERMMQELNVWLVSFPMLFLCGWITWRLQTLLGNWIRNQLPLLNQTFRRIAVLGACLLPVVAISYGSVFYGYAYFSILGYQCRSEDLFLGIGFGLGVNVIFETLFEADFVLYKYKESMQDKRQMEELSMISDFDILKNQVNPHFLFNCFNTLSSLISEDKQRAEQFLDELSKVYRYLLRNNEDGLSTLESELKFINSYFQLLKTRYGDAVQINTEIDKKYSGYLLPSLSLQLLVENAVKHNVLSKSCPLLIDILTTAGNQLVVNNNLQLRPVKAVSNKIGLENIRAKYKLLKKEGFQVMEDDRNYTVVLPLIWNSKDNLKAENFN